MTVQRKLELVGKSTARIRLTTEQEAEQMRRRTQDECAELRSQAEAAALETRRAAEAHAKEVREKADEDARPTSEAATANAKEIVKGRRPARADRRCRRRAGCPPRGHIGELERLQTTLAATIAEHRQGPQAPKRTANKRQEHGQTETNAAPVGKRSRSSRPPEQLE